LGRPPGVCCPQLSGFPRGDPRPPQGCLERGGERWHTPIKEEEDQVSDPACLASQSSRLAESPSKRVLDGPWMLSRHSLVVDGWASPAHPSPSIRVFDGIPLGFGCASDARFQPMAWSPVPPGSPSCRGGPLERQRVILGRLGRFVFRNPM